MSISYLGVFRVVLAAAAGAGLVAAAAASTAQVVAGPAASSPAPPAAATASVTAAALVCPGPELTGVAGLPDRTVPVQTAGATAPTRVLTGLQLPPAAGQVAVTRLPAPATGAPVTVGTARSVLVAEAAGPGPSLVTGTGSLAPGLAATQQWLSASGEARSLGTVACARPSADAWLLAGGGDAGRQERLLLANPGSNPVTVDLTLHGRQGPVVSPNGKGVVVPARSRVSVLLDAISGTEVSPAVHVVASGGLVTAVLNDFWLDGSVSAGSDDTGPAAAPSRDQVIPAVSIRNRATLRVVAPGAGETVVQARALTPNGPRALPRGGVVRVQGGAVTDLDLTGLPAGTYALQVRADTPVVAGALSIYRTGAGVGEIAWASSSPPITGVAGAPLPNAPSTPIRRALSLSSSAADASVEVVTVDAKGAMVSTRVAVAADSTAQLLLPDVTSVWVHRVAGTGVVRAGVLSWVSDRQGLLASSMPLADSQLTRAPVGLLETTR